ncbi:MAG TPA: hypothetical protein VM328_02855, partial [Fimbriimonadaceae bacterium]|nr:hypothetical protein [Fimbriimonadaceae bacterium]
LGPIGTLHCYVDAKTGALLNVDDMGDPRRGGFGGGGGRKPPEKEAPFRWPSGDLSLYLGKRYLTVNGAQIEAVPATKAPPGEGVMLALFAAGRAHFVRYFAKEGLLIAGSGSEPAHQGRPNKPLLDALRKLSAK